MGVTEVNIGLLGYGTVGSALARMVEERGDEVSARAGPRLAISRVGVRDPHRYGELDPDILTDDLRSVATGPDVDVVVELLGRVEPARSLLLDAVRAGKQVVTANKELLANHGDEIFSSAAEAGVMVGFEGAVGGGIPIVAPIRDTLVGDRLTRVMGIVNGTTNYVLTRMTEEGASFEEALAEAKELGFAEADPTDDLEGHDAAAKCAILATIAFDSLVVAGDVYREGISRVTAEDIAFADRLGHVIKLLAVAEIEDGHIAARVHPSMVPREHPLASVRESFNAVFVEGERVGDLMFYGRGAGGDPTATVVLGDVVRAAATAAGGPAPRPFPGRRRLPVRPAESMSGQYYLLLDVADRPGVLAQVAGTFGERGVSIKSVWQEGFGDDALLVLITHRANEGALRETVRELERLEAVAEVRSVMRVEGFE